VNILAVILARAGSAGLKDKHLRPLLGRPVIDYTFDHARVARRLTRVVVSSDCPAIRNAAERQWFETIARPADLATADASVQDVMLHALHTVESRSSFRADGLVVLYGNVPVRPEGVIDDAVSLLESSKCDSVRSFCPVGKWHPSWMSWLDGDHVEPLQSGSIHRRQDLSPVFLHDGAVVAVSRDSMLRGEQLPENPHAFFGVDRRAVRTGQGETVEIDEMRDLYMAEAVLRDRLGVTTRMAS
jgi:CMP-N,N'-diacetyllegionaminic acid synthase